MRIVSKIKDYYDHVGHRYGSDPGCTYVRGLFQETDFDLARGETPGALFLGKLHRADLLNLDLSMIVAGLHAFPVIGNEYGSPATFEVFDEGRHGHMLATLREVGSRGDAPQRPQVPGEAALKNLIRAVGAPVFRIRLVDMHWPKGWQREGCWRVRVDQKVPILQDCGVASLVSAEQMWQSIYMVLTSVLRRDPDKEPPAKIGNQDRIEAAGFDLKTSFRHPVRLRDLR